MPARPRLRAVKEREGNPGKRPIPEGVRLPAIAPDEPNWLEPFPKVSIGKRPLAAPKRPKALPRSTKDVELLAAHAKATLAWSVESIEHRRALREFGDRRRLQIEAARARMVARRTWRQVVPWLDSQDILAELDQEQLKSYCVGVARIDQCERDITRRGLNVEGSGGLVKNGSVTIGNLYREKTHTLAGDFGLTPLARDRLNPRDPEGPDEDSPFDV